MFRRPARPHISLLRPSRNRPFPGRLSWRPGQAGKPVPQPRAARPVKGWNPGRSAHEHPARLRQQRPDRLRPGQHTRDARPKLHATLAALHAGDTLMIYKPDRVARSMKELLVLPGGPAARPRHQPAHPDRDLRRPPRRQRRHPGHRPRPPPARRIGHRHRPPPRCRPFHPVPRPGPRARQPRITSGRSHRVRPPNQR